jgi:SnoaL-like domain/Neocarzinostatin family
MNRRRAVARIDTCLGAVLGTLLVVGCAPVPAPSAAAIFSSVPPAPSFTVFGASPASVALVVRFVDAFNAADLESAFALFADDANVSDCDFAAHTVVQAQGRDAIRAWLAARFADHDRLVIGSIFNHNPDSDRAVGVEFARRSSDTIARLGAPDGITPQVEAKVVLDASGRRVGAFANGPGGADPVVVAQACSVIPALTTDRPTLAISPSAGLRDGQMVQVRVAGFGIGGKVWLSECSSADAATDLGCGVDLAAQPFIVTGDDRAGSASFVVRADAPGRAPSGDPPTPCVDQCVVVATMGSGGPYIVSAISFNGP